MAQPVWITPAGSLGVIPETKSYSNLLVAQDPDSNPISYRIIAGTLPAGLQFTPAGALTGTPYSVSENVVSKFTVRAATQTLPPRIADRTFTITVTGNNIPTWVTPSGLIGSYYENSYIDFQFEWDDNDAADVVVVKLASGELPGGLVLSPTGKLTGYVQPALDLEAIPGYSITGQDQDPYDFLYQTTSKNFEFTLEVTDGKNSSLRTFYAYIAVRNSLTADTTVFTADTTVITADETPLISPFIFNRTPSDLGTIRSNNYFAYQFIGENYAGEPIKYAMAVSRGYGMVPGLTLDTNYGWYHGYIPDQGATETTYSFNVVAYRSTYMGTPIACISTSVSTNIITCDSTAQILPGQPIIFSGDSLGGIVAAENRIYYVNSVVSATKFTICYVPGSGDEITLTTDFGSMFCHLVLASDPASYTLTLVGSVDAVISWVTDSDLGTINNGDTSLLSVRAANRGGRTLSYRLAAGKYNLLPQGLELLPTGDIAGRVSFDTFSLDLGATTFDETIQITRNTTVLGTTFDLTFTFTVNAYAPDTTVDIYKVDRVNIINGGINYSNVNLPVLQFTNPVGSNAIVAKAGEPIIVNGQIAYVPVEVAGDGYTLENPAQLEILAGYGGTGAQFEVVMIKSGTRDVVSVFKTFTLKLNRKYNKPYQNLLITAMPPQNDRDAVASLLNDPEIFVPDWIYRPADPNFGVAKNITYAHAYGLNPKSLDAYVESLNLNHYWKNLVLGQIKTAQAVDSLGNVVYEVVYSEIVDNLVNDAGESVAKIVNLPYPIFDNTITQVYPNSLYDMRQQVVNEIGLVSADVPLPLWMTSTQSNGSVPGYTPAWVMAYTQPGRSREIAYYILTKFTGSLNQIDFEVDRYILDAALSKNWLPDSTYISAHNADPVNDIVVGPGIWGPPTPAETTTFDIYDSDNPYHDIGAVDIATTMAFIDINGRTLADINAMGGLDGIIQQINGSTLIFVQQEDYYPLPGNYPVWTQNLAWPDSVVVTYGTFYYFALQDVPVGVNITDLYYWTRISNVDAAWQDQRPFDPLERTSPDFYPIQSQTPNGVPAVWVDQISYQATGHEYQQDNEGYQFPVDNVYEGSPDPLDGQPGSYSSDFWPYSYTTVVPGGDSVRCLQTYSSGFIRTDGTGLLGVGEQIIFDQHAFGGLQHIVTAASLVAGRSYYITNLGDTNWNTVAGTTGVSYYVGQQIVVASSWTAYIAENPAGTGTAQTIYYIRQIPSSQLFSVSYTLYGPAVTLTNSTGMCIATAANQRMGIWTIHVDPVTTIVTLSFTRQTDPYQSVTVSRGSFYKGQTLYYPRSPAEGFTRVNWLPVVSIMGQQTTFDYNSLQFIEPVDMYNPGSAYDKYLLFPKRNILE